MFHNFSNNLTTNPKKIFLVDAVGALLTAFNLFAVLRVFNEHAGIPKNVLTLLAGVALVFCMYSISCYFTLNHSWKPYLKLIAIANLLYCLLTIRLVLYYWQTIKALGFVYFSVEVLVIFALVYFEYRILKR
jgi:hypothetical protein